MKEFLVKLSSFEDVKRFVTVTTRYPFPIRVVSDDKLTNAKSLIGFFSMDLSGPVTVRVEQEDEELAAFAAEIEPYLAR